MGDVAPFGVVLIAVDEYGDPPGPLPSSRSVDAFAGLITGERGGVLLDRVVATTVDDVATAFNRWTRRENAPSSSIVYLVGHGASNGLVHTFLLPESGFADHEIPAGDFGKRLKAEWLRRQADRDGWVLLILDCCASGDGVVNIANVLTEVPAMTPKRCAVWPVTPAGASHNGEFVRRFESALAQFTENDTTIPLADVYRRIQEDLGDMEPHGNLPAGAVLANPRAVERPLTMTVDAHAELRELLAGLPADQREHFVTKAQGSELGEVAWHFRGREAELRALTRWLEDAESGMHVVTGDAGSGKSALLGQLVLRANDELAAAYVNAHLAPQLDLSVRPRPFDAVIHLAGRTQAHVAGDLARQLQAAAPDASSLLAKLAAVGDTVTILADALDESQEPEPIADLLRRLAATDRARVVVGTRRSADEGPDRPPSPDHTPLLDALGVAADDVTTLARDRDAVRSYVEERLRGTPHAAHAKAFAKLIAASDQPFLFARLATAELLARGEPVDPDDTGFANVLEGGHRGLFAAAVARIGERDPAAAALLHALALSRGRGVPETGGVWVTMARALRPEVDVAEAHTVSARRIAAPYIALDGEGGQSVYRLSHLTFAEHFRAQPDAGDEHRRVAAALTELVDDWEQANHYLVRYLPEHWIADADRAAPDAAAVQALASDPRWLHRAVRTIGIDALLDVFHLLHRAVPLEPVDAISRALRRARVTLARDPDQLAAQLHGRLAGEQEEALRALVAGLEKSAPRPWLRSRWGGMDWRSELEATYTLVGTVRALAFGEIDGRVVLAIGVDDRIELWDPRRGTGEGQAIGNDGGRVTALAIGEWRGRPVAAVAAAYEGRVVVRDLRGGEIVAGPFQLHGAWSVAIGTHAGRTAIAVSGDTDGIRLWDLDTGEPIEPPPVAPDLGALEVASDGGALVAVGRSDDGAVTVADLDNGEIRWQRGGSEPPPRFLGERKSAVAGADNGRLLVGVIPGPPWLDLHRVDTEEGERLAFPLGAEDARVLTTGELDGRRMLASAPDQAGSAFVSLDQLEADFRGAGDRKRMLIGPVLGLVARPGDGVGALVRRAPLYVVEFDAAGRERDSAPANAASVGAALVGDPALGAQLLDAGSVLREITSWTPGPNDHNFDLPVADPRRWPTTAQAWAHVDGRPLIVRGSYWGAVWVHDLQTGAVVAGPPREMPQVVTVFRSVKPPVPRVEAVAMTAAADGPLIALAMEGAVSIRTLAGDRRESQAGRATTVVALSAGTVGGRSVLVTGSRGGVLGVWDLDRDERIVAITLDDPITGVWIVHGQPTIGALDANDTLHLFDLVT